MIRYLFFILLLAINLNSFSQVNSENSPVQILANWKLHDNQAYTIIENKFKIVDKDTLLRESIQYNVSVQIADSTSSSYIVEWRYDNFIVNSNNLDLEQLITISNGLNVKFKTDELGIYEQLINYEEIKKFIKSKTESLSDQFDSKEKYEIFISKIEKEYLNKKNFETRVIRDILQFHQFHGTEFYNNETYFGELQAPNMYGGEPFDSDITFWLEENDFARGIFEVKMQEVVNSRQFTQATYDFFEEHYPGLKEFTQTDSFPTLSKAIYTSARVHQSGWVIRSVQTSETRANKTKRIEVREIKLNEL